MFATKPPSINSGSPWLDGGLDPPDPVPPDPVPPDSVPEVPVASEEPEAVAPWSPAAPGDAADPVDEGLAAERRTARCAGTGGGAGAGDEDAAEVSLAAVPEEPLVACPAAGEPEGSGAWAGEAVSELRPERSSESRRVMATPLAISTTRADANASPAYAPRRCCSAKKVLPQTPQSDRPGDRNSRLPGR